MLTSEEIQQIVAESGQRVRAKLIDSLDQRVTGAIEEQLKTQIAEEVRRFVESEVLPELRDQLIGERPMIIAAAANSVQLIAATLTAALVTRAEKTLTSDYDARRLLKALLGEFF